MQIPKNASAGIVVSRDWANLVCVRMFLRHNQTPSKEIGGADSSHLIEAKVLDSEDNRGLWIELFTDQHRQDPTAKRLSLLVPWNYITAIVLKETEEWPPALQEEMGKSKIGF